MQAVSAQSRPSERTIEGSVRCTVSVQSVYGLPILLPASTTVCQRCYLPTLPPPTPLSANTALCQHCWWVQCTVRVQSVYGPHSCLRTCLCTCVRRRPRTRSRTGMIETRLYGRDHSSVNNRAGGESIHQSERPRPVLHKSLGVCLHIETCV